MNMMPNYLAAGLLIVAPLRSGIPTFTKSERVNGRLSSHATQIQQWREKVVRID